jgi:hypothetical protein
MRKQLCKKRSCKYYKKIRFTDEAILISRAVSEMSNLLRCMTCKHFINPRMNGYINNG